MAAPAGGRPVRRGRVARGAHVKSRGRPNEETLPDLQAARKARFRVEYATLQVEHEDHSGREASGAGGARRVLVSKARAASPADR